MKINLLFLLESPWARFIRPVGGTEEKLCGGKYIVELKKTERHKKSNDMGELCFF